MWRAHTVFMCSFLIHVFFFAELLLHWISQAQQHSFFPSALSVPLKFITDQWLKFAHQSSPKLNSVWKFCGLILPPWVNPLKWLDFVKLLSWCWCLHSATDTAVLQLKPSLSDQQATLYGTMNSPCWWQMTFLWQPQDAECLRCERSDPLCPFSPRLEMSAFT